MSSCTKKTEGEARVAQAELAKLLESENNIVAILPTAYGKTQFFIYNKGVLPNRVVHILPLQAIISDLYNKLKNNEFDVGYQMAMEIPEGDKRPFLSKRYMVTTFDSFSMDFYGIPVHEIYRSKWHSDLAFTMARTFDLYVFDEFHLMVSVDSEDPEEEFVKVVEIMKDIWNEVSKRKLILTATISPSLIKEVASNAKVLVLAPPNHPFIASLNNIIGEDNVKCIWDPNDSFYNEFKDYTNKIKTYIVNVSDYSDIYRLIKCNEGKKILVLLNHAWRVEKYGNGYPFIHGLFGTDSKHRFFQNINNYNVVFATQLIEAGVDLDFDVLITDIAPAYSLIQRAGRVSRKCLRDAKIYILVKDIEEQVKGVYSKELTEKTLEILKKDSKNANECGLNAIEVEINWRLPEQDKLDYLKLINSIDNYVSNIINKKKDTSNTTLDFLKKFTLDPPTAINILDKKFEGSFIRDSAIFPVYIDGEIAHISKSKFSRLVKDKNSVLLNYKVLKTKEVKKVEIKDFHWFDERPLSFIRYAINKARSQEKDDDDLSGYINIVALGFEVGEVKLKVINGQQYRYLSAGEKS